MHMKFLKFSSKKWLGYCNSPLIGQYDWVKNNQEASLVGMTSMCISWGTTGWTIHPICSETNYFLSCERRSTYNWGRHCMQRPRRYDSCLLIHVAWHGDTEDLDSAKRRWCGRSSQIPQKSSAQKDGRDRLFLWEHLTTYDCISTVIKGRHRKSFHRNPSPVI